MKELAISDDTKRGITKIIKWVVIFFVVLLLLTLLRPFVIMLCAHVGKRRGNKMFKNTTVPFFDATQSFAVL
jgi:hypothetical protein